MIAFESKVSWPSCDQSIDVGPDGKVYAVYMSGDELVLSSWGKESDFHHVLIDKVSTVLRGCCPTLGIDAAGTAHVSYFDATKNIDGWKAPALCYASVRNDAICRNIVEKGDCTYPSLAVSNDSRVALSYRYDAEGDRSLSAETIKLALYERNKWGINLIKDAPPGGHSSSLAFDSLGNIHLAFNCRYSTGACYDGPLFYASQMDGRFSIQQVDPRIAKKPSLAIDIHGRPHISYVFVEPDGKEKLAYATRNNGSWHITEISSAESWNFGGTTAIALTDRLELIIVFNDCQALNIAYLRENKTDIFTVWQATEKRVDYPINPNIKMLEDGSAFLAFMKHSIYLRHEVCVMEGKLIRQSQSVLEPL